MHDPTWDEGRLGSAVIRANHWRLAAYGVTIALLASFGVIYVLIAQYRATPPPMPDVWVIDPQSTVLWHGPPGSYQIKDLWVAKRVKEFLNWTRSRPDDLVVMGDQWQAARDMVAGEAVGQLERYFAERDPKHPRFVHNPVRVRLPTKGPGSLQLKRRSAKLYDGEWSEAWVPVQGIKSTRMSVTTSLTVDWLPEPPTNGVLVVRSKDMEKSELSVYVTSFSFDEVVLEEGQ